MICLYLYISYDLKALNNRHVVRHNIHIRIVRIFILLVLGKNKKSNLSLFNKIILIENADPGFDWIFSKRIAGLVTKYGGVNSHMSIRCEELNIPAIIGLGNDNFEKIKNNSLITVNCKNKQLIMR